MRALVMEVYSQLSSDLVYAFKDYKVKEKKFEKDKLFTGRYMYAVIIIVVTYYDEIYMSMAVCCTQADVNNVLLHSLYICILTLVYDPLSIFFFYTYIR